ncbi:MAG TPA: type II toxin-antitoxin system VapC family toxin [Thermoanaerobaculia bacterium]|nr:type II toxin-antitoxin system VapC family toxin [Thermoanaerobaculia bacterium]
MPAPPPPSPPPSARSSSPSPVSLRALSALHYPGLNICEQYKQERLVTDAEVLQEILHRYAAIRRRDAIQPAFDALLGLVDEVFPVDAASVERAKQILFGSSGLSARDALHLACMERHSVTRIMSFDGGFDGFPGISRISA